MAADAFKRQAAAAALDRVRPGMRLGLGTGSTAAHFVTLLAERVRAGLEVRCVPTSEATRAQAAVLGVPLVTLDQEPALDLVVDGADEIGPGLVLIKGGGGALLYEKIVAAASRAMLVIADDSKLVPVLGAFPLPIEVVPFGLGATRAAIERAAAAAGCHGALAVRQGTHGHAFVTDAGHWILDAALGAIPAPRALADALAKIPGVVEHGLFLDLATEAILAGPAGVRHLAPASAAP
jgi:ribose 5-phosphate isomerase A